MKQYKQQQQRLHQLRQVLKKRRLILTLLTGIFIFSILTISLPLLESVFWFTSPVRRVLIFLYLLSGLVILNCCLVIPVLAFFNPRKPPDDDLAKMVGQTFPQIRDRLVNALQIVRDHDRHRDGTSEPLAESSLSIVHEVTEKLDYRESAKKIRLSELSRPFAIVLSVAIILAIVAAKPLQMASRRLLHPYTRFDKPLPFSWKVHPGNIRIIQGDSLTLSITITGERPESVALLTVESNRPPLTVPLSPPFIHYIASVGQSFQYQWTADDFVSPLYHIEVLRRPVIRQFQVTVTPPVYSGLSDQILEPNIGDIRALAGSKAQILISASDHLKGAGLFFKNHSPRPMDLTSPNCARSQWLIAGPDEYYIAIQDTQNLWNIDPIHYSVKIIPDLNPIARITNPGKDTDLNEQMRLDLGLEAEDDYGFLKTQIIYWIRRGGDLLSSIQDTFSIPLTIEPSKRRIVTRYNWNLDSLGLLPQDVISYLYEVWDNDRFSGPKRGRSESYQARFPSMLEIFEDVTKMQNQQMDSLQDILAEGSDLQDKLNELTEDIKANREIPWEEKRKLAEAIQNQMEMAKTLEQLNKQIEEMTEKLQSNDLISEETLDKYRQLQELFDEIATPELQEAMQKLRESLEEMDQEALRRAAENLEIDQQMLMKSLDRTIALLQRIQIEQKIDEMIRRAEDLNERQQSVNERLGPSASSTGLADDEFELSNDARSFEKEMDNLSNSLNEIPKMPVEEMQSLLDSLDRQNIPEHMQKMGDDIAQNQIQSAIQNGQEITQNLSSMSESLQQLKQSMQNTANQQARDALQRNAFQVLQLSQGQENLMRQISQGGVSGSEAARQQSAMLNSVRQLSDSLYQLSTQMMMMSPQLGQSLGRAFAHMQNAVNEMQQPGGNAGQEQSQAMGALNETAAQLLDMLNDMQGGGMGGLGMDFMTQLGNMSEEQLVLNKKLSDLMGQGSLSMQQQAAMSRLAAEQRAIQSRMEQLMRDYGERSDVAGRLGDLIESMETVVQDIVDNRVSQKTIKRQEAILSRMLEAQRSMHERDFSRTRRAKTGQDILRKSPAALNTDRSRLKEQLLRDILRLNDAGYTQDYQELIRQYFEALSELMDEENVKPAE
jgi:hypothetical protein